MQPRHESRKHQAVETRLYLIEGDLDEFEQAVAKVNATLNKILWTLVGLLISTSTGAVLFALNLVVTP